MTRRTTTCAQLAGNGTKPAREQERKDHTDQSRRAVERELMKRAARGQKQERGVGNEGEGKGKSEADIAVTAESKDISA